MKKYSLQIGSFQKGFSLIELMITVGLVGIVMMFAIPGMTEFSKNDRISTFTNTLIADIMLAKSKAVQQNQPVILCTSDDQESCTSTSFEDGWIVGIDIDEDDDLTDANDQLIKVQNTITGNLSFFQDTGLDKIIFDSRGFLDSSTGSISICDDRGVDYAKELSISVTGRTKRGGTPSCS